jgi:SAM-dependent methyltransferase
MVQPAGFFTGTEMPTSGWWQALWPDPASVVIEVGITPGLEVIDLCCGDGWFTLPTAKIARHVVAIDIDRAMLKAAELHLVEGGVTNCEFVAGNAYEIADLVSHPVDVVFMANAFHGVPEPTRLARAIKTALKFRGRFVIVNWHARPREETTVLGEPHGPATEFRLSPEATIATVQPAGFKMDRVVELPPYHYGLTFEKR